jgi:hypothetical protein
MTGKMASWSNGVVEVPNNPSLQYSKSFSSILSINGKEVDLVLKIEYLCELFDL